MATSSISLSLEGYRNPVTQSGVHGRILFGESCLALDLRQASQDTQTCAMQYKHSNTPNTLKGHWQQKTMTLKSL